MEKLEDCGWRAIGDLQRIGCQLPLRFQCLKPGGRLLDVCIHQTADTAVDGLGSLAAILFVQVERLLQLANQCHLRSQPVDFLVYPVDQSVIKLLPVCPEPHDMVLDPLEHEYFVEFDGLGVPGTV